MIWDIWRQSWSLNEQQTWASMKRFGTPQWLQLLCHFPKQKIRNNWHGVTNPVCQSSEKAPGSTVLCYQFISSQLTLSPIKMFIWPFYFWQEPCPCSTMTGYIWRWSFCPNISHFTAWLRPMEKACVAWIFGTSQNSVLSNVLVPETLNHEQFRWWITWDSWHQFEDSTKKAIV